ncbi:MAG TPA: glycoside hydrolase family 16 protein [Pyrinomonadaceae bacterium]|jgi:hypothetical protein|nr:glycoside hydrolase family 16 protein [Pyrinomonadaceae bacterium]
MKVKIFANRIHKHAGLLIVCIFFAGCHLQRTASGPTIKLTRVPQAALSDPNKLDIIQGKVEGARQGQQIVLYVKTGAWWIQPLSDAPFTKLQPDGSWINSTHLGSEYAALLVDPTYRPSTTLTALPNPGDAVVAVATVKGADSPPSPTLRFSGYEWRIRNAPSSRGDTMNLYDPSNAWTDDKGALHLRIAKQDDKLTCAEVALTHSFGYGTYSFVVRDTSQLEPSVVFSMFTWDYAGHDQNNREMDIEISRWGDPASKNAQYVVQPFYVAANVARFTVPAGVVTYSWKWEPGRLSCKTIKGLISDRDAKVVSEHVFTSGVPSPGVESVRMALFSYGKAPSLLQNGAEVVIEKFEYVP